MSRTILWLAIGAAAGIALMRSRRARSYLDTAAARAEDLIAEIPTLWGAGADSTLDRPTAADGTGGGCA